MADPLRRPQAAAGRPGMAHRASPITPPGPRTRSSSTSSSGRCGGRSGRLSAQCQELLRIVAFIPRPDYQSVSAALGMPVGSIGPTRGRCLEKIRALLADELDGTSA